MQTAVGGNGTTGLTTRRSRGAGARAAQGGGDFRDRQRARKNAGDVTSSEPCCNVGSMATGGGALLRDREEREGGAGGNGAGVTAERKVEHRAAVRM